MPQIVPCDIPYQFTAGTTVAFRRQFQRFPATDGWKYKIFFNGPAKFEKDGVQDTDPNTSAPLNSWTVTLAPADSNQTPGWYKVSEQISSQDGSEVYDVNDPVDLKHITILANPATAPVGSFQTWEEKTLAILESAIGGNLSQNVQSYQIAGRAVSHYSIENLMKLRGVFKSIVWRQQHPGFLGVRYEVEFPPEVAEQPYPPTWVDSTGFVPPR